MTARKLREATGEALREAMSAKEIEQFCLGIGFDPPGPPADLHCHEARTFLALGDTERAEHVASAALRASDEAAYPQNHAIYAGLRARALIASGRVDDAITAAVPVVARVSTLASRRIATEARTTVQLLGKYRRYEPAVSFTAWASRLLPAA